MRVKLLLLFFLYAFGASAQTYNSFPTDSAYWHYAFWMGNPMYPPTSTWDEVMNGDTVIGTDTWSKVYDGLGTLKWGVRESNMKIYCYDFTNSTTTLAMDFTLSIGDTLFTAPSYFYGLSDTLIVNDIDTLLIGSTTHRNWKLTGTAISPIMEVSWIDGIGLIYERTWLSGSRQLICYFKENQHYYSPAGPWTVNCLSSIGDPITANCNAYFDPASEELHITSAVPAKSFSLMNTSGQLIMSIANPANSINLRGIAPGLYIIQLELQDGTTGFQKVIK